MIIIIASDELLPSKTQRDFG